MRKPNIFITLWRGMGASYNEDPQISLGWYRHSPNYKYRGLTIRIRLIGWLFDFALISDSVEYAKKFPRRERGLGVIPWAL